MTTDAANRILSRVYSYCVSHAETSPDVGLMYGQTGIALFLYLYSRYSDTPEAATSADCLLDRVMEGISQNAPIDYARGLSGFGTAVEFLARHGFVDPNTDDVLEPLDELFAGLVRTTVPADIAGLGKYLSARLSQKKVRAERFSAGRNREALEALIGLTRKRYGTYTEAFRAIDFLTDVLQSGLDQHQIFLSLKDVIAQVDAHVQDDIRFGNYPDNFNPLGYSALLVRLAVHSGDIVYADKARSVLHQYELGFRRYLDNDTSGLISGSLKWSVLYRYLGENLRDEAFLHLSEEWIQRSLEKEALFCENHCGIPPGVMDGYAGIGLAVLSLKGGCGWDWMDVFPVYYERGKVSFSSEEQRP